MVERNLAKVEVGSSSLLSRSRCWEANKISVRARPHVASKWNFRFPILGMRERGAGGKQGAHPSKAPCVSQISEGSDWQRDQIRASLRIIAGPRRGGRVVMQRPAKPCTPVRFRPPPPNLAMRLSQRVRDAIRIIV